jgi:RNA polymerase sigma-70 factor (ECF subfamily)
MLPSEADDSRSTPSSSALDPASTAMLLARIRAGDDDAMNRLLARCLPALKRWAHGRLPACARGVNETADLVQEAVVSTLKQLGRFEPRREGALQAYLRTAVNRRIIDLIRQRRRRPDPTDIPESLADDGTSPLDQAIGAENSERYEAALQRLSEEDREAIVCRLEMHYTYEELAVALDKPTANAARVAVMRAVHRLAQELQSSTGS